MAKQDCIPKKDADFLTQLKFLRDKAPAQKTVTLRGDVPAGAFPLLASGILNRLPAGDWKARAGGRRSAPSLPRRDAENGNRDGRAPQQCPRWWPCASTGQWQFGVDEQGQKAWRGKIPKGFHHSARR
jgi:hypothetical protein